MQVTRSVRSYERNILRLQRHIWIRFPHVRRTKQPSCARIRVRDTMFEFWAVI